MDRGAWRVQADEQAYEWIHRYQQYGTYYRSHIVQRHLHKSVHPRDARAVQANQRDEPGFLEIEVKLGRESGEANAWRRINKTFLHEIRRQLLLWRSFEDSAKEKYERLMADAQKNWELLLTGRLKHDR